MLLSINSILTGIFENSGVQTTISLSDFLLCVGSSLIIGFVLALVYTYKSRYTKSFVTTLALIPVVVCVEIMLVNGNIGAGVAVGGAFGLIRFRSIPGTAKEIGAIFLAMAAGLATGMGLVGYGFVFAILVGTVNLIYVHFNFGERKSSASERVLRITIPEDLDYMGVFDDLFSKYATKYELVNVKTTNMGSLFKLTYNIVLKSPLEEKNLIDDLRCRNGNLEIASSRQEALTAEL